MSMDADLIRKVVEKIVDTYLTPEFVENRMHDCMFLRQRNWIDSVEDATVGWLLSYIHWGLYISLKEEYYNREWTESEEEMIKRIEREVTFKHKERIKRLISEKFSRLSKIA